MPKLPDGDRDNVWADWMAARSARRLPIPVTKHVLRRALGACDDVLDGASPAELAAIADGDRTWITAHQEEIRAAIPDGDAKGQWGMVEFLMERMAQRRVNGR